jgi:NAD-dependent dihydropyrimidine dehydrogenase PreA subunit
VITIQPERCNGCGTCLEVCPNGALYLIEGKAAVDGTLCRDCQACIATCPTEAILSADPVSSPANEPVRVPVLRPEPELVLVESQSPVPLRANVLPVVGAALALTAREIVPRLAEYWLDSLDRRGTEKRLSRTAQGKPDNGPRVPGGGSGGRRRRRRRCGY